jgi:hypothetical protein
MEFSENIKKLIIELFEKLRGYFSRVNIEENNTISSMTDYIAGNMANQTPVIGIICNAINLLENINDLGFS